MDCHRDVSPAVARYRLVADSDRVGDRCMPGERLLPVAAGGGAVVHDDAAARGCVTGGVAAGA
jgi:hypothetical protein